MGRPVNLRQIEAFKALIETGTVSQAADLVGLSQPAVSKLIINLETDAELRLFDRVKGRLAPTVDAMRLYEEIGRIFAGVRQVRNALDAIRREKQGRLVIGVMPALSGSFIQRVTSCFLDKEPEVYCSFQTLSSQWIVDLLIARKLDIGLVDGGIENPYLTHEPLMEHALVCVMLPGHALAAKATIGPKDLDGIPFIALHRDTNLGHRVEQVLEQAGVRPRTGIVTNATQSACEFVAAGHGVALLHPLMLSGFEERLTARRFEPDVLYNFQLCRSADSRNSELVTAFANELRLKTAQIARAISLQ